MDKDIFKNNEDYWLVADNIKNLYLSDGSLSTLIDFERVLDELDVYAFRNWELGELIQGPDIGPYNVSCIFMWPERLMPDPRASKRLLTFDCKVLYKKTNMKVPVKIKDEDDFVPGTKLGKLTEKTIWLVEITIPKNLMSDILQGSIELEDETIDLQDLEDNYAEDLDQQQYQDTEND